jgi:hypothetical protein
MCSVSDIGHIHSYRWVKTGVMLIEAAWQCVQVG